MRLECAAIQPSQQSTSPRLFVKVKHYDDEFLVDTGSDLSAIPPAVAKATTPITNYNVFAANGSPITTHGATELNIDVGLPKNYIWNFVVAEVSQPIIGADFLKYYNILPDLTNKKLIDGATMCSVQCAVRQSSHSSISSIRRESDLDPRVRDLLLKHRALTKPPQYHDKVQHDVVCFIETDGAPTYDKPRRLRPEIEKEVRSEYSRQQKIGLVRLSKSQWASGLIVKKEKSKLRLIGDFRRLNAQTIPDRYPIPVIYDAISILKNKKFFSKIDLVRAFHNIPVYEPHIEKTAIVSPVGLYESTRMPFGLRNGPSTFQRFMDTILSDLPFCRIYLDDILVFSDDANLHFQHLQVILQRLEKNSLAINIQKCDFFVSELRFLGYYITTEGFQPTDDRIQFIKKMEPPKTITALRKVLGILNFYRQFTKNAAQLLAPLQEQLKGHPKKNDKTEIKWTPALRKVFEEAKQGFVDFTLLKYQRSEANLILTCDASKMAVGAVLEQTTENGEREPLGFFSKKLDERQMNWPAYDLELFAVYSAVEHFETMVEGRDLTIVTDHRPLTYLFTTKKKCKIERRSRYAEYIAQFSTKIVHVAGIANVIADALSRPQAKIEQIDASITTEDIARA